ncbi:MAG: phosphate regulon sensor histidine kinase PhoR [Betaproteobacteria bacterium]|nr:phosphate regulon sensor histidine kinase PhoR [Betaproteobacteria bacterium]
MQDFWWPHFFLALIIAAVAVVIGLFFGWTVALLGIILVLLYYIYRNLRGMAALAVWLAAGGIGDLPEAQGTWDEIFYGLDRMARRNKRSAGRLVSALDRFEHAAQAIPDGVIMLNEQGQIDWLNSVASVHFGLDERADCGQFIAYLIRQSVFRDYLEGHDFREPLMMKSPSQRDVTLSVQMVRFGAQQKMLISRDITQIEKVEAMRRDFVANVSHELRTPLTVVGGFLENFIDMDALPREDFLRYCGLMVQQTDRMRRLVEDLLVLSRLESTQNRLIESRVDMADLMQSLYQDALSLSAGRHPIEMVSESEDQIIGNVDELASALGNLVSNAVRYTPSGKSIRLHWGWREGMLCFGVKDEGEGIAPHHIPRLTERFYRVDRGRSRETGGTGLGLAIVKHVLTRHHAKLLIESEIGRGSCFSACFTADRVVKQKPG